jgi:hypothetical protein
MYELRAAQTLRSGEPVIGGPLDKSAFDLGGVRVAVRDPMGQDVPDDDQDFASNDGDGLLSAFVRGQTAETVTPVREVACRP